MFANAAQIRAGYRPNQYSSGGPLPAYADKKYYLAKDKLSGLEFDENRLKAFRSSQLPATDWQGQHRDTTLVSTIIGELNYRLAPSGQPL